MSDLELVSRLRCCNLKEVCDVPYKGLVIPARLTKVLDGDTVKVIILLGEHPLALKVRLAGIDAPETTLKGQTTQLEKDAGLAVKKYVCDLLQDIVYIKLTQLDKYGGRYVGNVYVTPSCAVKDDCVSKKLLALKYAKAYDGGKKALWEIKELEHITQR